jgi:hypothetical protein
MISDGFREARQPISTGGVLRCGSPITKEEPFCGYLMNFRYLQKDKEQTHRGEVGNEWPGVAIG